MQVVVVVAEVVEEGEGVAASSEEHGDSEYEIKPSSSHQLIGQTPFFFSFKNLAIN